MYYIIAALIVVVLSSCSTTSTSTTPPPSTPDCRCVGNADPCGCPAIPPTMDLGCTGLAPMPSSYSESVVGPNRVIVANGIPNHAMGTFPINVAKEDSILACCIGRPTAIAVQSHSYTIPAVSMTTFPLPARTPPPLPLPPDDSTDFGIAFSGVPFDPAAAEWWESSTGKKWALNALLHPEMINGLDCNNAHVQPDGAYHYHGFPQGLYNWIRSLYSDGKNVDGTSNEAQKLRSDVVHFGWAVDGNPIYGEKCGKDNATAVLGTSSYSLRSTTAIREGDANPPAFIVLGAYVDDWIYASAGSLDQCNGHYGPTPEFPDGVYHYHITKTFPYIPRCIMKF